jgi:hypothetical protein
MPRHIFFSWQMDTDTGVGRNLIERALERSIGVLKVDADVEPADRELAVDRDTVDVPGSPPIVDTIFSKIDRAAVFISDLTYVAERADGRKSPNPNVLIEHGWALKTLSWRGIIGVMNTAAGHPDQHPLPFDLQHFRRPILYECAADATIEQRQAAKSDLTKKLTTALKAILADEHLKAARLPAAPHEPHPHDVELLSRVRAQLSENLRRFLHQHNFGTPFQRAILDPIDEMNATWVGANFEFDDPVLQESFDSVRRAATTFGNLALQRIHAMDRNPKMGSPKTDYDLQHGVQPETLAVIKALNEGATELSSAVDDFDRIARGRVRVPTSASAPTPPGPDPRSQPAIEALGALALDAVKGMRAEIVSRPSLTLSVAPLAAMEAPKLEPKRVADAQLRFPPTVHDRVQTDVDQRQWWTNAIPQPRPGFPNPEARWRMRLVRPGLLEYEVNIGRRIDDDKDILVDGRKLEAQIVLNLDRMAAILDDLGLGGPALVEISLQGIEDVTLIRSTHGARRLRIPELRLPLAQIDNFSPPLADQLRDQLDMLWQAGGSAEGSPSFGGGAWDGYSGSDLYEI